MNSNSSTHNEPRMRPILIMAGGTGGHIFPALAVAKSLQSESCPVTWIGTPDSMESELVPRYQVPIRYIKIQALRGKGWKAKLLLPLRLFRATFQALAIIREVKPAAVLGMGGFVTGPGGLAAWISRKPLLIHEQNAIAGMTNRYLAKISHHVFEAFPNSFGHKRDTTCIGNPLRAEIVKLHQKQRAQYTSGRPLRLLVVGGSLGALVLNEMVPSAIAHLLSDNSLTQNKIEIRHQTGERTQAHALDAYKTANVQAEVVKFIDDMSQAYQWADIIICRAGALTVSEVSAAGVPAIFVPFPYAVDDHQRKNAEVLAQCGAAEVIVQTELTPQLMAERLHKMITTPGLLVKMSERSKAAAKLKATDVITQQCLHYARAAA
jgi:UDP-N-acetylglucosamine--N-acetylmuramyl-(pentapeptide) pyrophosphoryl-undecaprenol N-acetylglucosamine transferase